MNELSELFGLGSWPEPPDIVPLRILGLEELPASRDMVKSAFRDRLKQVHPDIDAAANPAAVAELTWARDVLTRKIPADVTGNGVTGETVISRYEPQRCKSCGGTHRIHGGSVNGFVHEGRWRGYCGECAHNSELDRQRERRRQARANRTCTCGATFTPARSDARYCSPACRQRAHRERQAGKAA